MSRSAGELWLVEQIRESRELDLFGYATPGANQLGIDPDDPKTWTDDHKLSAAFIRELLSAESIDGIQIPSSLWLTRFWCDESIDLSGLVVRREVIFELSRFEREFCARAAQFESNLWFSRCSIGNVIMDDCSVDGTFRLEGRVRGDFWAMTSKFGRSLTLGGAIGGEVSLQHSHIEQGLHANGLFAREINIEGATIKSIANLSNARVENGVWAADVTAQCTIHFGGLETPGSIELSRGRISGSIDAKQLKSVRFLCENASVGGDVFLQAADTDSISLISTEIRDDLHLGGATIRGDLLLLRARIGGYLVLSVDANDDITWGDDSNLVLTDLSVGIFTTTLSTLIRMDRRATTPRPVAVDFVSSELSGFRFSRIGTEITDRSIVEHGACDLVSWIEGSNSQFGGSFNPTPFTNFSAALRTTGFNREADDLLVALYQHKMTSNSQPRSARLVLFLSWLLIGFGYRAERAVVALLLFASIGVVAGLGAEGWQFDPVHGQLPPSLLDWVWNSVSNVVPFMSFGTDHNLATQHRSDMVFETIWNVMAALGAITAVFLLAAISGFARRRYR